MLVALLIPIALNLLPPNSSRFAGIGSIRSSASSFSRIFSLGLHERRRSWGFSNGVGLILYRVFQSLVFLVFLMLFVLVGSSELFGSCVYACISVDKNLLGYLLRTRNHFASGSYYNITGCSHFWRDRRATIRDVTRFKYKDCRRRFLVGLRYLYHGGLRRHFRCRQKDKSSAVF